MSEALKSGLYRIASGDFKGALVRFHFINTSGNADCRFEGDFGPHRDGEIVVAQTDNLTPEEGE